MPTTVNFTSLKSDISNYLERGGSVQTDPTVFNQIPRLINAAERKLAQVLKLLGQIEVLSDSPSGLQSGQPIISKPDRWRQTISISYGTGTDLNTRKQLFPRSYEYCTAYWPDRTATDSNNPPAFYCDIDYQHWMVSPTPDQDYPLEVLAYCQPPLLDSTNQTNFFTDYTPNALLYGALLEATPFLKDDPRLQTWSGMWGQEIQTLSGQDLQRILDRSAQRKAP
jgi:hypothetical protein